jgi:hypothetical protein
MVFAALDARANTVWTPFLFCFPAFLLFFKGLHREPKHRDTHKGPDHDPSQFAPDRRRWRTGD